MERTRLTLAILLLAAPAAWGAPASKPKPPGKLQGILEQAVDPGTVGGVVAGVVTPKGNWRGSAGRIGGPSSAKPDAGTLFEIGSLSKAFLTLLLLEETAKGTLSLDAPVTQLLPEDMPFPKPRRPSHSSFASDRKPAGPVRIQHLLDHTSGFPERPSVFDIPKGWSPSDPSYVTLEMVRDYFGRYEFPRKPGDGYEYSNINTALLGWILARKTGEDLEALLKARVLSPLGLKDTAITLSPDQRGRMARGHDDAGNPAGYLRTPTLFSGGGTLRSSLDDLMRFMSQALELSPSPLRDALARQRAPLAGTKDPSRTACYFRYPSKHGEVLVLRGRTLGFRGCLGFLPSKQLGIVVLGNSTAFDSAGAFQAILETVTKQDFGPPGAFAAPE